MATWLQKGLTDVLWIMEKIVSVCIFWVCCRMVRCVRHAVSSRARRPCTSILDTRSWSSFVGATCSLELCWRRRIAASSHSSVARDLVTSSALVTPAKALSPHTQLRVLDVAFPLDTTKSYVRAFVTIEKQCQGSAFTIVCGRMGMNEKT